VIDVRDFKAVDEIEILEWVAPADQNVVAFVRVEDNARERREVFFEVAEGAGRREDVGCIHGVFRDSGRILAVFCADLHVGASDNRAGWSRICLLDRWKVGRRRDGLRGDIE
jgi:hypothetical protein